MINSSGAKLIPYSMVSTLRISSGRRKGAVCRQNINIYPVRFQSLRTLLKIA